MSEMLIECTACHTKYNADQRVAGKRVRCKHCGTIFEVPLQTEDLGLAPDDDDLLDNLASLAGDEEDISSASATAVHIVHPTVAPNSKLTGGYSQMLRTGDAGEYGLASDTSFDDRRPNTPFRFPAAAELDQWLPWILAAGGLLWAASLYFRWEDDAPLWVSLLRPALYIGLFLLILWPLGAMGVRKGAEKARLRPPPQLGWRTLGIFTLPFLLGSLLWIAGGDAVSLIMGLIVGLVLAVLAMWLLLRLTPQELAPVGITGSAGFLAGCAIVAGLILGGNLALLAALRSQNKLAIVTSSPLGATLSWEAPPPASPSHHTHPLATAKEPNQPAPAKPPAAPASRPAELAMVTAPAEPSPASRPAQTVETVVAEPPAAPSPSLQPAATTQPAVGENENQAKEPAFKPASPIVAAIDPLADVGDFDDVVYPTVPSTHVAIVRTRGSDGDVIESWSLDPLKKEGTARFNHAMGQHDRYIISPDGDLLVRIVNWPKLAAQVWSFGRQQVIQSIDLDGQFGRGTLLGFANSRQFVLQWQRGSEYGLEYLDAVAGRHLRQVPLPRGQRNLDGYAFSPDGHYIAVPAQYDQAAYIVLYEFPSGRSGTRFKLKDIDPRTAVLPAGISFSPDGRRIAVLFQQNGNGLLLCWNTTGLIPPLEYIFPNGFGFTNHRALKGTAIQWLDEGAWLLWGRGIIDTDTGRFLGEVGLDDVQNQQWIKSRTIELTMPSDDPGKQQLVRVQFSPDHLADAKHAAAQ
jgi:predicted Zn finger-like uncharacterized protein